MEKNKPKYIVKPLVARQIEFSTGTIFGGTWCRYFISITLHQTYIEATWKVRPKNHLDEQKDDDMISQYTYIYNAIEKWESDHRETEIFQQLAVSELFNQLNK